MKITKLTELTSQPVSHDPRLSKKVMISNGEVPHLTNFSQAVVKSGQSVSSHQHKDMYEVFFINQGTAQLTINNEQVTISKNMCITIEPTEEHSLTNTSDEDLIITYFGIVD